MRKSSVQNLVQSDFPGVATMTTNPNHWSIINEILGSNKQFRADTLGEILKHFQADTPKVLSDLQSSGILYKPIEGKSSCVKNADLKKSLSR